MLTHLAFLVIGIVGTVVYNHFFSKKVADLGNTIVSKAEDVQKKL